MPDLDTLIQDRYQWLGGQQSPLGGPLAPIVDAANAGRARRYQRGWIYCHEDTGAHAVHDAIATTYAQTGGPGGVLGYPESEVCLCHDQLGQISHFQRGVIARHPTLGAFEVHGDIVNKWKSLGAERSVLGYPRSNEQNLGAGIYRSVFQHGAIYWSASTGAHPIYGAAWQHLLAINSQDPLASVGLPLQDEAAAADGSLLTRCQRGTLWVRSNGAVEVRP